MVPSVPVVTRGPRISWEQLPPHVRDAVVDILGGPVASAVTQRGGFSPGAAARLRTADGRTAFVKAVSAEAHPDSPLLHRMEARHAAALPETVAAPRLLGAYDDGTWVALVFEDVPGHQPHVPWREDEFGRVLDALRELSATLTPSPVQAPAIAERIADKFRGWDELAASGDVSALDPWVVRNLGALRDMSAPWVEAAAGDTLAHCNLRADNMLLTGDRVVFVDWPHASLAAPWFDLLVMLPCARSQGGPDPEEVFTGHPLGRDADPEHVTAVLAALTGYFVSHSRRPAPPGLPTVRALQHAQGVAALDWLRRRLARRRRPVPDPA